MSAGADAAPVRHVLDKEVCLRECRGGVHGAEPHPVVVAARRMLRAGFDGPDDEGRRHARMHRLDQGCHARRQRTRRAGAVDQPILPVIALCEDPDTGRCHLDGQIVAGKVGRIAGLIDRCHREHARVIGGIRVRRVRLRAVGCLIAGIAGRGHHHHLVVIGELECRPDDLAGRAISQGHADNAYPVPDRVHDGLRERPLALAGWLILVLLVGRVLLVREHPDREHRRLRRHAADPAVEAVPVTGDERRHPRPVHAPFRVGRRGADTAVVGPGDDRADQIGHPGIDPAVDHGDSHPLPLAHRPGGRRVDRVQHPLLRVSHAIGAGRARYHGGAGGYRRGQGQQAAEGQPAAGSARGQHPGAPGQRGNAGSAPSGLPIASATPLARLVISSWS